MKSEQFGSYVRHYILDFTDHFLVTLSPVLFSYVSHSTCMEWNEGLIDWKSVFSTVSAIDSLK